MSAETEDPLQVGGPASSRLALLRGGNVRARRGHLVHECVDLAVVRDLHTTASGVQSAIALEALVSAAFILINSKTGDLIGRKRAYVIGLLAPPLAPWR